MDSCTETTAKLCELPGGRGGRFKLPKLEELHLHLFGEGFAEAHNAAFDVEATARVFLELLRLRVISPEAMGKPTGFLDGFYAANTAPIAAIGLAVDEARKKRSKGLAGDEASEVTAASDLHAADVDFQV